MSRLRVPAARRREAAGIAAIVLAGLVGAAALLVASTFPRVSRAAVPGLTSPVEIEIDGRGIPTIRAGTAADALAGLGYAHARDRLWQMEFQRRIGAGRLSEILGPRAVETDRVLRTIGFRRAAAASLAALAPETRRFLNAYVAGVNAYLRSDPARSIEFRILHFSPEPFGPVDCLVWVKMMAWDLAGNARDEVRRARLVAALGADRARELLPIVPAEPTILRDGEWSVGPWSAVATPPPFEEAGPRPSARRTPFLTTDVDRVFGPLASLLPPEESRGSNSWVVAGSRTRSGKPLLANDPHLGLRTPSVWYLARLEAPGLSVEGATLPGVPGVVIGHNARIGWGLTSVEPDVQDLYVERVDPRDPAKYFHDGAWRPFAVRTETIHVRGATDVTLAVRESVHGPIVTDAFEGGRTLGGPVALRWTGLDAGDTTPEAFLGFDRARDWTEFLAAARRLKAPAQNVVYADVDGHIGYTATGTIPIRPRSDGLLPVSGEGADDWIGSIPFDALPRVFDPPRGYVVTANNRIASPSYPWPISSDWPEPYRADRITKMLRSSGPLDVPGIRAIQLDRHSEQADDLVPLLLDTEPADARSRRALQILRAWDRTFSPDSVGATVYAAWYTALSRMTDDELPADLAAPPRSRFVIDALRKGSSWCDDARTPRRETCSDLKTATLAAAVADLSRRLGTRLSGWRWSRLHRARFPHGVFDSVVPLRPFFSLETGQGGDASTVNVGGYRRDGSYRMTDGPSYRQILDFADLTRSTWVHTTGQSGNVFDRRYRDLLPLWREGGDLPMRRQPARASIVLSPAR